MNPLKVVQAYSSCTTDERDRGARFWEDAHLICAKLAEEFDRPLVTVAGIMAALSPNNSWRGNQLACRFLLELHPDLIYTYKRDVRKAQEIYALETREEIEAVLRGPKTISFFRLMADAGNRWDVCIDGHMVNLLRGTKLPLKGIHLSRKDYDLYAAAVREATYRYLGASLWPCHVQAILWIAWRASNGLTQGRLGV